MNTEDYVIVVNGTYTIVILVMYTIVQYENDVHDRASCHKKGSDRSEPIVTVGELPCFEPTRV